MKIEIFKVSAGWYFRIKGRNGKIIAQSEGYKTRRGAVKTASLFKLEIVFV